MANAPMIPKIPPIRTDIQEPQQSSAVNRPPAQGASNGANSASNGGGPQHRTSKEWYYYWSKVGDQVVQNTQTLANLVTYGPHAGRPDPSTMPDGALAVESDRGVIYQKQLVEGVPTWVYIAGTMWGTLSPDQRPTDLGANDAGFEFRTTDDPAREFVWSQAAWVETTPVRYGTHAERLAVNIANIIDQMLWVETDRLAIYQNIDGVWQYIAGTMWGTLSPDQRPTDLGTHDAGFDFRTTDEPPREFIWSQAAWVETSAVTGVMNLTHPNVVTKVSASGSIAEGSITDAGAADANFVYIASSGNVGIGTTSPLNLFSVIPTSTPTTVASSNQITIGEPSNNSGYRLSLGYASISSTVSGVIQVTAGGGGNPLLLNPSGGNVGIGTLTPGAQLDLSTDSARKLSTTTWATGSDIRIKQNIRELRGGVDVINRLRPVECEHNGLGGTVAGTRTVSLIAQEVQPVLPGTVTSRRAKLYPDDAEETDILDFNPHEILFQLILAAQQLDRRVSGLEKK